MTQILPKLFLGDIEVAQSKESLKQIQVTHILCVTNTIDDLFPEVFIHCSSINSYQDFKYKVIKINDMAHENILLHLDEGIDFIA